MSFEVDHLERLHSCAALEEELLVSGTGKDLGTKPSGGEEGKASDTAKTLLEDWNLDEKAEVEIELRAEFYARLRTLWGLMLAAGETRDDALSLATSAELKTALHREFRRRNPT